MTDNTRRFLAARDLLLDHRDDFAAATARFSWPRFESFNWARDYFDAIAAGNDRTALRVVADTDSEISLSFAELAGRSAQVANFLAAQGVGHGDRVLLMLDNCVPLWESMLAAIRMGAVIVPATTLLKRDELGERLQRGAIKAVITHSRLADRFAELPAISIRIAVGEALPGWASYASSTDFPRTSAPRSATRADDPLLLYFTSGTTSRPKLVMHSHASYPVGHLSTMYWLGLKPGDVHLNLSSPGWAKHAWSCFFAPWNAEATVLAYQYERFDASRLLDQLVRQRVTTFCAPPTVWRMLITQDLRRWQVGLREAASAGEPLNPEVIAQVRAAWGITIRDAFGQTETSALVGNSPGQPLKPGSMGRPLPGCPIVLLGLDGAVADEGEICIDLTRQPVGLMRAYLDDPRGSDAAMADGYYRTGDIAARDADGYLTYIGRTDDVFKSSDYRISPFELESVLIEHPAVAEAAVVPSPDPVRLAVPKAFIALALGFKPDAATALSIFRHMRARVSDFKRIRRLQFSDLPKTISGKIRRVELRTAEQQRSAHSTRHPLEFREEDFPVLEPKRRG
jgi:acetyl-CoA synthetase